MHGKPRPDASSQEISTAAALAGSSAPYLAAPESTLSELPDISQFLLIREGKAVHSVARISSGLAKAALSVLPTDVQVAQRAVAEALVAQQPEWKERASPKQAGAFAQWHEVEVQGALEQVQAPLDSQLQEASAGQVEAPFYQQQQEGWEAAQQVQVSFAPQELGAPFSRQVQKASAAPQLVELTFARQLEPPSDGPKQELRVRRAPPWRADLAGYAKAQFCWGRLATAHFLHCQLGA